jgi:hypothetical protein
MSAYYANVIDITNINPTSFFIITTVVPSNNMYAGGDTNHGIMTTSTTLSDAFVSYSFVNQALPYYFRVNPSLYSTSRSPS